MNSTSCACGETNYRRRGTSSIRDPLERILLWFGEAEMAEEMAGEAVVGLVGFWSCS